MPLLTLATYWPRHSRHHFIYASTLIYFWFSIDWIAHAYLFADIIFCELLLFSLRIIFIDISFHFRYWYDAISLHYWFLRCLSSRLRHWWRHWLLSHSQPFQLYSMFRHAAMPFFRRHCWLRHYADRLRHFRLMMLILFFMLIIFFFFFFSPFHYWLMLSTLIAIHDDYYISPFTIDIAFSCYFVSPAVFRLCASIFADTPLRWHWFSFEPLALIRAIFDDFRHITPGQRYLARILSAITSEIEIGLPW